MNNNIVPSITNSMNSAKQLSIAIGLEFTYNWDKTINSYSLMDPNEVIYQALIMIILANSAQGLDYESCMQDLIRLGLAKKLTPRELNILKCQATENEMAQAAWKIEHARALLWSVGLLTELSESKEFNNYSNIIQLTTLEISDLRKAANFQAPENLIAQYIFCLNYFNTYEKLLKPGAVTGMENIIGTLSYQTVLNRVEAFKQLLIFNQT